MIKKMMQYIPEVEFVIYFEKDILNDSFSELFNDFGAVKSRLMKLISSFKS